MHAVLRQILAILKIVLNKSEMILKSFVIAISEIWLDTADECKSYQLEGYVMYNTIRTDKRGGGVTLYVHDSIRVKKSNEFSVAINDVLESITIELHIEKGKNIIISCIYRVPGSNIQYYSDFIEQFLHVVQNKSVYIVGDTNIDILKYENHVHTKDFVDMLYSYGVFPQINKPTRVTSASATIIDNIFTNVLSVDSKCGIVCNDISDHLPIFYVTEYRGLSSTNKETYKIIRRCSEKNINKFKKRLETHDWKSVLKETNVDKAYDEFITRIKTIYNEECPQSKVKVQVKNVNKPWFTTGLKNACLKKNKLYRQFVTTRLPSTELKYKRYKNKLTSILRFAEKNIATNLKYVKTILKQLGMY